MQPIKGPLRLAPEDVPTIPDEPDHSAGAITMVGGCSAVLSTVMPWIETTAFGISLIKIDVPGVLLAGMGAVSIFIAAFLLLRRQPTRVVAIAVTVLAVAQLGLSTWHLADIVQSLARSDSRLVLISAIGTGLYLGVLGSLITLVGGIVAWIKSPSQTA